MPIDPSIPLQAKNPQIETGMNQLAMMGDAMKIGEMQRGIGVQNELRNLYAQGVDVSTPEGFKQVAALDPATALKLRADALQGRKLEGDIKKTGVEIDQKTFDLVKQKMSDLAFNPSNENIIAHLQDGIKRGEVTPQQAEMTWKGVSALPLDKRAAYFTDLGMKAADRAQRETTIRGQDIQAATTRRGQDLGRIPVGYRMTTEGTLEAMPGGPTTTNLSPKEMQAREAKYPVATQAVNTFEAKTDQLAKDLITLRNHPGLSSITGIVAGRAPAVTSQGREAQALYDKIVARGGFKELQDMRAASPTGGALGNVSNQEGTQLRQSFAAIDRRQDAPSIQKAIDEAVSDLQGSKTRVREAYDMTYDYKGAKTPTTPPTQPDAGGNSVTIPGGKTLTFPTPEAAAAYKKAAGL
jgi:hypothetical protein